MSNGQQYMSEPLSSHEIEDVLSSIRRLVSEELRPAARAATPAAAAEAGKLLLTPALRVVAEAQPEPELAPTEALTPEPEAISAPLAEEALLAPATEDYDDLGMEELPPLAAVPTHADADVAAWEANEDVLWSAPGTSDDSIVEAAEDDEAPLAEQLSAAGHWSAQEVPQVAGLDWVQEEPDWVEPDPVAFTAHPRKPILTEDPLARAWADRAEAEVHATLDPAPRKPAVPPEPAPVLQADGPGLFDGDDPVLDEESLREIVRDIIREELAGALGERITRNVRKLVRVEINRALTAREFE